MHIFKYEKNNQEKRISRILLGRITKLEDKLNSKIPGF